MRFNLIAFMIWGWAMGKLTDNRFLFGFNGRINRVKYWYALFASLAFGLVVMSVLALAIAAIFGAGLKSVDVRFFDMFGIPPSLPFGVRFGDTVAPSTAAVASLLFYAAGMPIFIVSLWLLTATSIKRLHDRDKRGWWIVLFFIIPAFLGNFVEKLDEFYAADLLALTSVVLNLWGVVELVALKGTAGPNRFGSDPLAPIDPRPHWDQQGELEFVPHNAGPPAGAHVMRGHD